MLALGRLYRKGLGAPQDFVEAHKWFNLAASRGNADAAGERNALAGRMTPQQVAAAQEPAVAWCPGRALEPTADPPTDTGVGPPPVEALREALALLAALGYAPGPADGMWGARSVQAYRAFLRDAAMPVIGQCRRVAWSARRRSVQACRAARVSKAPAGRIAAGPLVAPAPFHDAVRLRLARRTGTDAEP